MGDRVVGMRVRSSQPNEQSRAGRRPARWGESRERGRREWNRMHPTKARKTLCARKAVQMTDWSRVDQAKHRAETREKGKGRSDNQKRARRAHTSQAEPVKTNSRGNHWKPVYMGPRMEKGDTTKGRDSSAEHTKRNGKTKPAVVWKTTRPEQRRSGDP